jgi:hypothetical protein
MHFGAEYRLVLEGFTPDTIPMVRLAEYMQQLAKMLGQDEHVHFEKVENNCTALVSRIDPRGVGKVAARVKSIRDKTAPSDAMKAFNALNSMLGEDSTTAVLKERKATIIRFPGTLPEPEAVLTVPDEGTVIGYLYMLSDGKTGFQARISLESGRTLMCTVPSDVAKKLRDYLFETVKVSGPGVWTKSQEGEWSPAKLDIKDVVRVESASLRSLIDKLRTLQIEWFGDDYENYEDTVSQGNQIQ